MAQGEIRFDERAILVTGAGRGLGRAQALLIAARGAQVVVADNGSAKDGEAASAGPAEVVVAEIRGAGGKAIACTADIGTEDGAAAAVAASLDAFGRIDGLIHYASPCPDLKTADKLSSRDLERVTRVNSHAGMWMARAAWPHLVRQQYGRIVYTTSAGAYGALGNTDYAAAKAANIGMMRCLALEGVKDGILVNAVAPSALTRMTEGFHGSAYAEWFSRTMRPEHVATGAAWLLSESCHVHGEIFAMGGGRIARVAFAEAAGLIGSGTSIEEVHAMMPRVMADSRFFYPRNLGERSAEVAAVFGFEVPDANRVR